MTENVFDAKDKLMGSLGWQENPFVKDLRIFEKESFMKYYCPLDGEKVLRSLAFDSKACVLAGPKGVGKTSALYYAYYSLPGKDFYPVMLKEPPSSLEELGEETGLLQPKNIFQKFVSALSGGRKVSRQQLVERLRGVGKKIVLFVDESHLAREEMHMEFKYLLDEVPNLRIVFSALGTSNFPDSLMHLVGEKNVFQRKGFNREEMRHIIKHRIEAVGGQGTAPFAETHFEAMLSGQNLLSPRYVFDELNSMLAKMAFGEKEIVLPKKKGTAKAAEEKMVVAGGEEKEGGWQEDEEKHEEEHPTVLSASDPIVMAARTRSLGINTTNADWWALLTPSQQQIMLALVSKGSEMSLNEICSCTGLGENTAFNCLYQLRGEDDKELERKKEVPFPLVKVIQRQVGGKKKNLYHAEGRVKNLFTMH